MLRVEQGISAGRADGDGWKGNLPDSRVTFRVADDDGRRLPLVVCFVNHADASGQRADKCNDPEDSGMELFSSNL